MSVGKPFDAKVEELIRLELEKKRSSRRGRQANKKRCLLL
jgi:hypothetical protein